MKVIDICKRTGTSIIDIIAILLIGFIFAANLIRTSSVDIFERVSYASASEYLLIIPIVLCVYILYLHITEKINVKIIFAFFSIIYIIAGIYLILNTSSFIRDDAGAVWNIANECQNGDFSAFQKVGYIGLYPFQLGMLTYDIALHMFSENEKILYMVNLLWVLIINLLMWKMTSMLFENQKIEKLVIFLEFAFLPQFFFIMFGYGIIPGFCCFMAALYFFMCLYRKWAVKYALLWILFLVLASLIKPNYKIGAIAMILVMILKYGESKTINYRSYIAAFALIVSLMGATHGLEAVYSQISGIKIGKGTPISVHIAMGTDLNNEVLGPGWFDGYTQTAYIQANCDAEITDQNAKEKIKTNVTESLKKPFKAIRFYWKKILSTWCEPMFQSTWSGPTGEGIVNGWILSSLYSGGIVEKAVSLFSKTNVVLILAASLCFALKHIKNYPQIRALYLYFIGGFIFHFFSETKNQYVYMYMFVMLPMAAYELLLLLEFIRKKRIL